MNDRLWVPETARVQPTERKKDGGSWFDDELETQESHDRKLQADYERMVDHINTRPDHVVFVGDTETRDELRTVFNHMFSIGVIGNHPTIKIDYGVPTGSLRIHEDRS